MTEQEMRDRLAPELHAREKVLWVGKGHSFRFDYYNIIGLAFICVWLIIPVTMFISMLMPQSLADQATTIPGTVSTRTNGFSYGSILFPGLFLLIGGVFLLGIIWSIVSPKLQIYAVTNKRALIYVKRFRVLIVSINLGSVSNIRRTGRENIGTIHFVESNLLNRWNGWFAQEQPTAFFGIKNPKNLEALILEHFKSQDTTR